MKKKGEKNMSAYSNVVFMGQHDNLEWVERKISGTRQARAYLMRSYHAALLKALDSMQQDAMYQIDIGWRAHIEGVGYAVNQYMERVDGQSGSSDFVAHRLIDYKQWRSECIKRDLGKAMFVAIDIIGFGKSMNEVKKERFMDKSTIKACLIATLNIFCEMKGWKKI